MSNTTANITGTYNGTGFTVDVTALNLSADTNVKDFVVINLTDPLVPVIIGNSNFIKQTPTSIQYTGTALVNQFLSFRRRTPLDPYNLASNRSLLSSFDYNEELKRISRRAYELELNGVGSVGNVVGGVVLDTAYGVSWNGDTFNTVSRNALYDKIVVMDSLISGLMLQDVVIGTNKADLASPAFTGTPTTPTPALGVINTNQVANAAMVGRAAWPVVVLEALGAQSIPHNVTTVIQFNTETLDTNGAWNTATHTFTVPYTGVYEFDITFWYTVGVSLNFCDILVNGTTSYRLMAAASTGIDSNLQPSGSIVLPLTAGNTVQFQATQNNTSSAARTVANSTRPASHAHIKFLGRSS